MKNKVFKGFILFISIFLLGTTYLYAEEIPAGEATEPQVVVEEMAPTTLESAPQVTALAEEPPVSELQLYTDHNMSGLV